MAPLPSHCQRALLSLFCHAFLVLVRAKTADETTFQSHNSFASLSIFNYGHYAFNSALGFEVASRNHKLLVNFSVNV